MNVNDKVRVKGTTQIGVIIRTELKFGEILNKKSKVLFIWVKFESGLTMQYTIDELKLI